MEKIPKLNIQWSISNECNFTCSYCHPDLFRGDSKFPGLDKLVPAFVNFNQISQNYDNVLIEITGGEPTLSKDLQFLISSNDNEIIKYKIVSNGFADLSWWESIYNKLEWVSLTYHAQDNLAEFSSKAFLLKDKSEILVPIEPLNWAKRIDDYKILKQINSETKLQMLYNNFTRGNNQYLDYEMDQWNTYYREQGIVEKTEIIKTVEFKRQNNLNDFYGHMCWAGVEQAVITLTGNVHRGWCFGPLIGNLYSDTIRLFSGPRPCPKYQCTNGFDLKARKSQGSWGMH